MSHTSSNNDAFFKWVGKCITEWAAIDHELFMLCGKVLKVEPRLVSIVYYSTPSLGRRIDLVDALLETLWQKPQSELTVWGAMRERIRKLARQRNLLAHGSSLPKFNFNTNEINLEIITGRWESLKAPKAVKCIRQDEIEWHFAAVHSLSEELLAFRNKIDSAWPEKLKRKRPSNVATKRKEFHLREGGNVVVLDRNRE